MFLFLARVNRRACCTYVPYLKKLDLKVTLLASYKVYLLCTYIRVVEIYTQLDARVVDIIKATHTGWIGNICIVNNIYGCTYACYKLIRLAMSVFAFRKQLRCHQFLVHSLTCNKFFVALVVRVPLHTRVFFKFKSSHIVSNRNPSTFF